MTSGRNKTPPPLQNTPIRSDLTKQIRNAIIAETPRLEIDYSQLERRIPKRWYPGDRVTREIYLDDGTWARKGDHCLPGPLKRGEVIDAWFDTIYREWIHAVAWGDGTEQHGLLYEGLDRDLEFYRENRR